MPVGDEGFVFRGYVAVAAGIPASFDPAVAGAQLLIEDLGRGGISIFELSQRTTPILGDIGCPPDGWKGLRYRKRLRQHRSADLHAGVGQRATQPTLQGSPRDRKGHCLRRRREGREARRSGRAIPRHDRTRGLDGGKPRRRVRRPQVRRRRVSHTRRDDQLPLTHTCTAVCSSWS
jgi:hypothetical protein